MEIRLHGLVLTIDAFFTFMIHTTSKLRTGLQLSEIGKILL